MNPAYYLVAAMLFHGQPLNGYTPVARIHDFKSNASACEAQKAKAVKQKLLWSPNPSYTVRYQCMTEKQWQQMAWKLRAQRLAP